MTQGAHRGWHDRGYLPHFDQPGSIQHVVFSVHGSVPKRLLEQLSDPFITADERRTEIDAMLDRGEGPDWLSRPEIADLVVSALRHFDGERYQLIAWCSMPNHVHVVARQFEGWPLAGVVQSWKSFTAKGANRCLATTGAFWAPEYFDREVRDAVHLATLVDYVEANPVKAGLCGRAEDWRWSSAGLRHAAAGATCAGGTPALPSLTPASCKVG